MADFEPKKKKVGRFAGTKEFLYNPRTKEVLGRSGVGWLKLLVFYLIFYGCLAGFFAICISVFLTITDKNIPTRSGKQSIIKAYPGMGFRPMPDVDSTLIRFEQGLPSSYKIYTDHIQAYLDQYEKKKHTGEDLIDCSKDRSVENKDKACNFDLEMLSGCRKEMEFGYDEGRPCVLLKLNKVYDWEPDYYNSSTDEIPDPLKQQFGDSLNGSNVFVTCEGENPADEENIGNVTFFPSNGFAGYYFPYKNQQSYRSPLLMVKFDNPANGILIQVWCKAWAKNLYHHKNDRAGSIHFELLVD